MASGGQGVSTTLGSVWVSEFSKRKLLPCRPPFWAQGGQLQTILGHSFSSVRFATESETRVLVPLDDGGQMLARHRAGRDVVVYLFHGLGGDANSDYIMQAAQVAASHGFAVFRANHRNCGEGVGLAPGPYHSGRAEDLSAMIRVGKAHYPDAQHLAIGFSLSGNALLLLLSGLRGREKPDMAVAVNAPINLARTSELISKGFNRLYDLRFGIRFQSYLRQCQAAGYLERPVPAKFWWKIRDYDEHYTAPYGGFRDPEHYYETCSTMNLLAQIQTPTLILSSKDDPIVSVQDYLQVKCSPWLHLHLEEHGGHIGYLSQAKAFGGPHWLSYFWQQVFGSLAGLIKYAS